MVQLKIVKVDDIYETIHKYISNSDTTIETYDDMINNILSMIKDGYCFIMERDYLRDAMESLTYMYSPNDDINKDRIILQFADEEEDDDDDEEDEEELDMDMLKMMQMMGMAPPRRVSVDESTNDESTNDESTNDESTNDESDKTCPVSGEVCDEGCSNNTCNKDDNTQTESEEVN